MRVLRAVLAILLAGAVLVAGSIWLNGAQAAREAYDRILVGAASDIAGSIRIQDGQPRVDLPVSAFELLAQAPDDRVHYSVTGPGGDFLTGLDLPPPAPEPERAGDRVRPLFYDARLHDEPARFVRVTRRFAEREFSGEVAVTVGQTLHARRAMTLGLVVDALLPMALAGLALLLISWVVVRSAMRPLEALSADLARRDPYDLTPMPTEDMPRELQAMLGAMNRFMARLDRQVGTMRTLISDTAHQLRTPVAAIRVQAETLVDDAPPGAADERALSRLLARTRSLGTLLDQLLSRALVIHRSDSAPRGPVDLREVALEVVEASDHAVLAPGTEVRLEIGDAPVTVRAEAFSLGEAAKNLLANALRHGRAPVAIGAEHRGPHAVLWVEDGGPGPEPQVMARLGGRFERSTTSGEDGAGLGFAIVKAVAEAFDGRVETGRGPTGFRVSLVLPAAPAAAAIVDRARRGAA